MTISQLQSVSDGHGFIELLELKHDSFIDPIRLVNDTRDWYISGYEWIAMPFRAKWPSATQGESPRAQLQIDNVGREITGLIDALPVGAIVWAHLKLVSRATPEFATAEFVAPARGFRANMTAITCEVGPDDAMRQSAVRMRFDPTNAPGVFAG